MTDFDTVTTAPAFRRDRYGRYLLTDPATGKERAWQRVTTLVKMPSDTFYLEKWKMRRVAKGLSLRTDLLALAAASDIDDRQTLDKIVQNAIDAAQGAAAANTGTAIHAMIETIVRGGTPTIPAAYQTDIDAWRICVADVGIITDPELTERVTICTDTGTAGTFDMIVTLPDGTRVVADIKTGRSTDFGAAEWAAQLSIYSRGLGMWNGDGWDPMPDRLRQDIGIIMHVPAGQGICTLHQLDLIKGWEWAQLAVKIRESRKTLRKAISLYTPADTPTAVLDVSGDPALDARRMRLLARCRLLHPRDAATVRRRWPAGTPGLKGDQQLTAVQLDAIDSLLDEVDGPPASPAMVDEAVSAYGKISSDMRAWVDMVAADNGIPNITYGWTEQQANIVLRTIGMTPTKRDLADAAVYSLFGTTTPDRQIVIDWFGGRRQLLAAGKHIAETCAFDMPRSSDQILDDPTLLAATIHMHDISTTTTKDTL